MTEGFWGNCETGIWFQIDEHERWMLEIIRKWCTVFAGDFLFLRMVNFNGMEIRKCSGKTGNNIRTDRPKRKDGKMVTYSKVADFAKRMQIRWNSSKIISRADG